MLIDSTHIEPQATFHDSTFLTPYPHNPSSHNSLSSISAEPESLTFDPLIGHKPKPKAPYTKRLRRHSLLVEKILKFFKQVKVNVSLLGVIQQVRI